eukprot:198690_1
MKAHGNDVGSLTFSLVDIINNHNKELQLDTILIDASAYESAYIKHSTISHLTTATNVFVLALSGGDMNIIHSSFVNNNVHQSIVNVSGINGELNILYSNFETNNAFDMLVFDSVDAANINITDMIIDGSNHMKPGNSIVLFHDFRDMDILNLVMKNNDVEEYLVYATVSGNVTLQTAAFVDNQCDLQIFNVLNNNIDNNSPSITISNTRIDKNRESTFNQIMKSLMSINNFDFIYFETVNFTRNNATDLLAFALSETTIDFSSAIISNNMLQNYALDFNGVGTISIKDSEFIENDANILISAIGRNYDINTLTLHVESTSFVDNTIDNTVFELGNVTIDLLQMSSSKNTLFANIISVTDITMNQCKVSDMNGIHITPDIPELLNDAHSKITLTDTNFTTSSTSQYFAITGYLNSNDELHAFNSRFESLPIKLYSNEFSNSISNQHTVLLFDQCVFDQLNKDAAFQFKTHGNAWYPNITFDSSVFNNVEMNISETEMQNNPQFTSSIKFKQCVFNEVYSTVVFHTFSVTPFIHISFESISWQNYELQTPFLIAQLQDRISYPCNQIPTYETLSLLDSNIENNKFDSSIFEVECSNTIFQKNNFINNNGSTKLGLLGIGGGNNLLIDSCDFISNHFDVVGLIYDYGQNINSTLQPMVTIRDSNFIGNSASNGAIISIIYNETNQSYYGPSFIIDDSVF